MGPCRLLIFYPAQTSATQNDLKSVLIPGQAAACTDCSQSAKSIWKCDAMFSKDLFLLFHNWSQ